MIIIKITIIIQEQSPRVDHRKVTPKKLLGRWFLLKLENFFRATFLHNSASTLTLNGENICETDDKYITDRSPNNIAMTNVTVEIF